MRPTDVTVAVPCFNAAETLTQSLDAIMELQPGPARVLCIDDGSEDETSEIINGYDEIERIRHEENQGASAARNTALERTETPGLATVDADVVPEPEWLEILCDRHTATGAAAVGGRLIQQVTTRADRWRVAHMGASYHDDGEQFQDRIATSNTLFEVAALRDVGGWDDRFHVGGEDIDLSNRLRDSGYEIFYTPRAEAHHVRSDTPRSVLKQLWYYHFSGRNEPTGFAHVPILPLRLALHCGKASVMAFEDIAHANWEFLPITLRLPIVHLTMDIHAIAGAR